MTVKTIRSVIIAATLAIAALATASIENSAHAQVLQCGLRGDIIDNLGRKFHETRRGIGLVSSQRLMELYASQEGSWTIVFTSPNGMSCIGAAGRHWHMLPPSAGTKFTPSGVGADN